MAESPVQRRFRASGRVQGVFFRDSVRSEAAARGVAGWVRNRADGAVEGVFEGPPDAVAALLDYCRAGPGSSQIEQLDVEPGEPEGLSDFRVR